MVGDGGDLLIYDIKSRSFVRMDQLTNGIHHEYIFGFMCPYQIMSAHACMDDCIRPGHHKSVLPPHRPPPHNWITIW